MSVENTATIETLLSADVIAFYIWVLGVAIASIWNKTETNDWLKLGFKMLGYIILAASIAIAIWCWVGPNGVIALAVIFLAYPITKAYMNLKK